MDVMDAIGQPIAGTVRMEAATWLLNAGLSFDEAVFLTDAVATALEADKPDLAQRLALNSSLDVTGYYRLAAMLLAGVAAFDENGERC